MGATPVCVSVFGRCDHDVGLRCLHCRMRRVGLLAALRLPGILEQESPVMSSTSRLFRASRNRRSLRRSMSLAAVAVTTVGILAGATLAAPAASAATVNPTPAAGARRNATQLPFGVSGTASISVDVGTGNALFTDNLLTLPGVRGDVGITLSYNSSVFGTSTPSAVTGATGSGWAISGFDQRMVTNGDGSVTYYGPTGVSGVFTSSGGVFTAPSQFRADLTGSQSAGYTLTGHSSQGKLTFNPSGRLTKDTDRDGNVTTYNYDPYGYPSSMVSSRGPSAGRTATFTTSGGKITKITQTSGSLTRSVSLGYTTGGHLGSVTDTTGGVTSFSAADEGSSTGAPDTGQVKTITNPRGKNTYLAFTGSQVASVSQFNPPIDGGVGESVTRLSYASSTQTLVADPTTNQTQAVSVVPHTTYTIDANSNLVTSSQDPDGNQVGRSYTGNSNVASTTPAAGGSTTYTYGKNSGESLTNVATPGGAADSAQYNNTGGSAYLPSSSTDDAGNALTSTYDTNGNQTGSSQGASGPSAKVTYNGNGTPATSASPGAATGVTTNYSYGNSDGDVTQITAPASSSLGARSYTWDDFGRLATATDGAGHTITYTYDNADRITKVQYSDATHEVDYTYDANGHVTQRVDAAGRRPTLSMTSGTCSRPVTAPTATQSPPPTTWPGRCPPAPTGKAPRPTATTMPTSSPRWPTRRTQPPITRSSPTTATANAPTCGCNPTPGTPSGPRTSTSPTTPQAA